MCAKKKLRFLIHIGNLPFPGTLRRLVQACTCVQVSFLTPLRHTLKTSRQKLNRRPPNAHDESFSCRLCVLWLMLWSCCWLGFLAFTQKALKRLINRSHSFCVRIPSLVASSDFSGGGGLGFFTGFIIFNCELIFNGNIFLRDSQGAKNEEAQWQSLDTPVSPSKSFTVEGLGRSTHLCAMSRAF